MVLAVSLVLVLFINMYTETTFKHQATLADLHESIEVTGYITGSDANQVENLGIDADVIKELEVSGFVARGLYTRTLRYLVEPWPQMETQLHNILFNAPKLVGANDISAIGVFTFAQAALPEYMEGYDEGLFSAEERVCIVSNNFLVSHALELGDEVQLTVAENPSLMTETTYRHSAVTLQIVGVYASNGYRPPIYCPWQVVEDIYREIDLPLIWDSASFILQNTQDLDGFKALLREMGFVSHRAAGQSSFLDDSLGFIINDRILTDATASVEGYIELSRILFPIIYLLCAGIGFIVSYLLVRIRKPEFAVMRSLGTSRGGGFVTFFLEQGLLVAVGTGLGIFLTIVITEGAGAVQPLNIVGYILCYLVGAAIAIFTLNRVSVIHILTARE
jgi:hypothetical protein